MLAIIAVILAALCGPVIDDLKALKQLPDNPPTYSWSTPNGANADEVVEVARITGSVGLDAGETSANIAKAVEYAGKAQAKRAAGTKPIVLSVVLRPWKAPGTDPLSDAAWKEVGAVRSQSKPILAAIQKASFKPKVAVLIDAEGLSCREEPARSACQDLYATYDFLARYCYNPIQVEWYGFGPQTMPVEPDGWGQHAWVVPFDGLASIGFDLYRVGEVTEKRMTAHKAVAYADSLGIVPVTPWISIGCGRAYTFDNKFHEWSWEAPLPYSQSIGEETYQKWWSDRPGRFMPSKRFGAVVFYPAPLDQRLREKDPELKHFRALIEAATK